MIKLSIPGRENLELHHLVLDMNGTLTVDGQLPEGIAEKLEQIKTKLNIYMLTADTFGTGTRVANELDIGLLKVSSNNGGQDKADFTVSLKPSGVIAIGNGFNDSAMFKQAQLAIAVIGQEGCCVEALLNADLAVNNIKDALDMINNPLRIIASLRR